MYARYVPPPKGTVQKSPEPLQTIETVSNSVKSQPTAYARYIPPSKPVNNQSDYHQPSQHVHFQDDINGNEPPNKKPRLMDESHVTKESKKKNRKSKQSKEQHTSAEDLEEAADDELVIEPASQVKPDEIEIAPELGALEPVAPQQPTLEKLPELPDQGRKEKKIKKKSKKKGNSEAQAESEDETPIRHKAVLERAAKSIRAPELQSVADKHEDTLMQDAPDASDGNETKAAADNSMDVDVDTPEIRGLQPLPQPKPVVSETTKPAYETLPSWLAKPIRVSPQATAHFTEFGLSPDLGITSEVSERLAANGYKQAFAIQTAAIPLLLPHHDKNMHGDVLVSAATGSGKTLAYVLPLVRDLSQGNRHLTKLRAVVVLPTRELVKQVQQVCEECAGAFALNGTKRRVRVGISMGSQSVDQEQAALVEREEEYNPEAFAKRNRRLAAESEYGSDDESGKGYNTEDEERAAIQKKEDRIQTLPDHVIAYKSKVDILICTPGRLVEHIKYTPGFSLDFVRWLVVDEADKLLGQNFQQWLDIVIPRLQSSNGSRNHKQSNLSGVRKVILSATMTRDLDRLEGLKLRWPKLIILEGSGNTEEPDATISQADLALPETLGEAALKVSDPNLKPLFLLDLLQSNYILGQISYDRSRDDTSDSDTSSSGSDSDSDSDSGSDSGLERSLKTSNITPLTTNTPSVLIFTKSNETALRLSRLLSLLSPKLGALVGTLTSTTQYVARRRTIRSFLSGKLRILVASDLVARGIDLPTLDHVVNYDMPSSIASYIHRVGRTARAGKTGKAWTLFTNPEARWFWNEVASETAIQRSKKVERIRVTEEKEDAFERKIAAYDLALKKLGEEASGWKSRPRHPKGHTLES
ncbi:ATP-dependent RNA helicase dbp6 [Daldinia childiae]|uniref:ATP-dependent RNA helicase dbp6 n=1 Tax=Daldinia childiae TaxID=326645 RepID=UPI00144506C5|nr:ATP-dependent RNA helicase dbp6 [Daldinia childiae]KAF3067357.1 ATP-dependent RNA helicase dbp6 [Daldinia childiae]